MPVPPYQQAGHRSRATGKMGYRRITLPAMEIRPDSVMIISSGYIIFEKELFLWYKWAKPFS
jgi:hypothetical protein